MDCTYTPTTPNSKSKFTFDYDEKRLEMEVELLEEKKSAGWAVVKQVETKPHHYDSPESTTTESSENSSTDFFTPMVKSIPKISVTSTSPFASPLPGKLNFFMKYLKTVVDKCQFKKKGQLFLQNLCMDSIYNIDYALFFTFSSADISDGQKVNSRAMLCSKRLFNSPKLRRPSRS